MSQSLPYDEIKTDKEGKLEDLLNISDDRDNGYLVEVGIKHPDLIKEKTKNFPLAPGNKFSPQDEFTDYMNDRKLDNYTQNNVLLLNVNA